MESKKRRTKREKKGMSNKIKKQKKKPKEKS